MYEDWLPERNRLSSTDQDMDEDLDIIAVQETKVESMDATVSLLQRFTGRYTASVCELHFHLEVIRLETSRTDDSTGRTVTASLPHARLLAGAIPSIFPDCPKYLTSQRSAREAPEAKWLRLDSSALQNALQKSAETFQLEVEEDRIQSLKDLAEYVRCNSSAFWHALEVNERLILLHNVDEDAPSIKYSVTIKPDLTILFHYLKAPTQKLERNTSIPDVASGKIEITEVLEGIEKWDRDLISTATTSKGDTVETVRALLAKLCEKKEEDDVPTIKFLIEQLKLLCEKKVRRRYSPDVMVFACLLFTISPHAYRYT
ncbi:hypothetical protein HPB51_003479 [Rhipicephalus microplus]|uniref:Uncharacterized protein n=1 Tax=Rhipicephalus microplus TaxID=6941 RepID=A0A9J6DF58_RHIMP|nr:hypothetical protein HPB51_003479 [Rhipicephalus microplus]